MDSNSDEVSRVNWTSKMKICVSPHDECRGGCASIGSNRILNVKFTKSILQRLDQISDDMQHYSALEVSVALLDYLNKLMRSVRFTPKPEDLDTNSERLWEQQKYDNIIDILVIIERVGKYAKSLE